MSADLPPNLTDIKRPKSYNKKKDSKRDKISTPRYNQPLAIEHVEDSTEINIDPPVENQHSSERVIQTNDSPTDSIEMDTNDQQVYNEPVPVHPERLQEGVESAELEYLSRTGVSEPKLELACNVGCPPSPSTVRSRDHTVLYCTIVLYSTKIEKICLQTSKEQTKSTQRTKNRRFKKK